jgi:signal peptidase II
LLILNSEFKTLDKISNFPLILIFSGAISNLIDRLYFGCVIDFINLKVWPIFNLADIFICVGVFFLIIKFYKK